MAVRYDFDFKCVNYRLFEDGDVPVTFLKHFEKYAGNADGSVKKYEEVIVGNDSDKTFTVTHGLGTKAVDVAIYDKNSNKSFDYILEPVGENKFEKKYKSVKTEEGWEKTSEIEWWLASYKELKL